MLQANQLRAHIREVTEGPKVAKPKLTRDQKAALKAYNEALRQEDRYLGSVFANAAGQRAIEGKTKSAYDRCKALGMTHEHGL
ncbi:hypothetical protein P3T25_005147 [Paraburkholderia sp. GAS32]